MKNRLDSKIPFLFYYSLLYELNRSNLKIDNLKGFQNYSVEESKLWQSELKSVSPIIVNSFYAILEEMRFMYSDTSKTSHEGGGSGIYAELAIRSAIIGFIINQTNSRIILDDLKTIDFSLYEFFSLCSATSEEFFIELEIDNFQAAISSLHGFADIFMGSEFINNLHSIGEKFYMLLGDVAKNGIFEKFFSPFKYANNSIIGLVDKNHELQLLDIIAFKDCLLWAENNGESSLLSFSILDTESLQRVSILETFRVVGKADKYAIQNEKIEVFRKALISFVFVNRSRENNEIEKQVMASQNIKKLKKSFWLEYNKTKIAELMYRMDSDIEEIFSDFKAHTLKMEHKDAYYLLFSNLKERIMKKILSNRSLYFISFTKEEKREMATIIGNRISEIILKDILC